MKMKEVALWMLAIILVAMMFSGLSWLFTGNALLLKGFFDPKFEDVRRTTFEQSKSYRDGSVQDLRAMQIEYLKAKDDVKPALAAAIRHKAAGVPEEALPRDLNEFIRGLH